MPVSVQCRLVRAFGLKGYRSFMIAKVSGTCSEGWARNDNLRKKYTACYFSFHLHEVKNINHQFELEQILGHLPSPWCLQYARIFSFFIVVRRPQDIKIPNLAILLVCFFKLGIFIRTSQGPVEAIWWIICLTSSGRVHSMTHTLRLPHLKLWSCFAFAAMSSFISLQ